MFEWTGITTTKYKLNNQSVDVKIINKFVPFTGEKVIVPINGRDVDHLAYKLLGTELESLNLMQINAIKLTEYGFNLSKLQGIMIPL